MLCTYSPSHDPSGFWPSLKHVTREDMSHVLNFQHPSAIVTSCPNTAQCLYIHIVQIITPFPFGAGENNIGGNRWGGLASCTFWQLTETFEQFKSSPFLWKNAGWRRTLVLFFWHVFLIMMMVMIWKPPAPTKVDSKEKNASTNLDFFFPLKPESKFLGWPGVNPHHQNLAVVSTSLLKIFPSVNREVFT